MKSAKLRDYLLITPLCLIYAVGISIFLSPNALAPGGVSGIAIILNQLTSIGTGLTILILNIPLLIVGYMVLGGDFLAKTIFGTIVSSGFIEIIQRCFPQLVPLTEDMFLASIAGGVLMAVGLGGIFRLGGSTGGTDIVAKLLRRKFPTIKTGQIFLIIDSIIVLASSFVTKNAETALYAAVALAVSSYLIDVILYGTDEAKFIILVSSAPDKIASRLMKEIDVGVTYLDGTGAYSGEGKQIVICAVKKHQFYPSKKIISEEDPASFMIVCKATEIFGKGHKPHGAAEL